MDRPKMMASIRIGMVGSMEPVGVNWSRPDRCPHWKIHTTTPNVADSDSTFITIALTGSTTDPKARNIRTNVDTTTSSAIHGSTEPSEASSSTRLAVVPPTSTAVPVWGGRGGGWGGQRADLGHDVPGRVRDGSGPVADVDAGGVALDPGDLGPGDPGDGVDAVQVGG